MPKLSKICARQRGRLDAGRGDAPADLERPRRDRAVPEAAGVGRDAEVQVRGDLRRPRHAERVDDVGDHLAARGGRRVEPVHGAVHRVAEVVIDVDDEVAVEARDVRAASRSLHSSSDHGVGRRRRRARRARCGRCPGNVAVRRRHRIAVDEPDRLAERVEREGQRQLRSDRIAVGPRVRRQDERLPRSERGGDARPQPVTTVLRVLGVGVVGLGVVRSVRRVLRPRAARARSAGRAGCARCGPGARRSRRTRSAVRARGAAGCARRSAGAGTASRARAPASVSRLRLVVADERVVDARQLQVGRDLHARERHEADAGVVHLAREQRR